ncbi:uncharacterized protein LOC116849395 [Odontomachus brunneus]|uniref:uncharacterized protein LOC116849395 n=1 Tax=Odontomachus brunneus TaxID=486640 RepID=UPI0013F208C1|nr:uncharacterized protein LOC116849395 [Odontomachus brunneus]
MTGRTTDTGGPPYRTATVKDHRPVTATTSSCGIPARTLRGHTALRACLAPLRRIIGEATLIFEETTLLAEMEAHLNSKSLQAMTNDPEDLSPLTPDHFLIGAPILSIPEPLLVHVPDTRLSHWRLLQKMRDYIWQRWFKEYLTSLLPRSNWRIPAESGRRDSSVSFGQRVALVRAVTVGSHPAGASGPIWSDPYRYRPHR